MANDIYKEMRVAKDECYTTRAEADKLVDYLIENNLVSFNAKIWLPFDSKLSRIYQSLQEKGFNNLIMSGLEQGLDFFHYEPDEWDVIISNPPFSGRTKLMNRLFGFNKPFIILQGTQYFNNQYAVNYLSSKKEIGFILPRSRMSFMTYNAKENVVKSSRNGASFYSFWLCYKIKLQGTFNALPDNGREKDIERMDLMGNPILDNHYNLFTYDHDE